MRRLLPALVALLAVLVVAGCGTTGKDAVATGQEFQFVAPAGRRRSCTTRRRRGARCPR